ncbi:hypothetical protein, partial [Vibrio aerogenes]
METDISKDYQEAVRRIKIAKKKNSVSLDLYGLSLTQLPESIQDLSDQLRRLDLSDCDILASLQGIENLTQLQQLDLSLCENLTSLQGIENLSQLQQLYLSVCERLTSLQGIEKLTQLQQL